jgi:hypothetical protein
MSDVQSIPTYDDRKPYFASVLELRDAYRGPSNYDVDNHSVVTFGELHIPQQAESVKQRFERLAGRWVEQTRYASSLDEVTSNDAYQQIIRMGPNVVSLILSDLRASPKPWFYALRRITGANPIPRAAAGNLSKMTAAWLSWGRKHGYRVNVSGL